MVSAARCHLLSVRPYRVTRWFQNRHGDAGDWLAEQANAVLKRLGRKARFGSSLAYNLEKIIRTMDKQMFNATLQEVCQHTYTTRYIVLIVC